jgi:polar amino acid transport system substrate-binding protein
MKRWSKALQLISLGIVLALAGGPASAEEIESLSKLQKDDAIYAAIPQKFKDAGVINAATANDYPPFEFLDEKNELIGADIDIAKALSKIMGVTVKNNATQFSAIVPGIEAGRFDIGLSSIGDYVKRQKVVDFVDYYQGGTSFLVRAGDPEPKSLDDLCGTSVGALKGTASESQAKETSDKCVAGGKKAIEVSSYPTQNDAVLALKSGRIQSVSGDSATNGYTAKQIGESIKNVGRSVYADRPYYGIAIPKNSPLFQPVFDAMAILMKSGVYEEIIRKWGLEGGAITEPGKNLGKT